MTDEKLELLLQEQFDRGYQKGFIDGKSTTINEHTERLRKVESEEFTLGEPDCEPILDFMSSKERT